MTSHSCVSPILNFFVQQSWLNKIIAVWENSPVRKVFFWTDTKTCFSFSGETHKNLTLCLSKQLFFPMFKVNNYKISDNNFLLTWTRKEKSTSGVFCSSFWNLIFVYFFCWIYENLLLQQLHHLSSLQCITWWQDHFPFLSKLHFL